MQFWHYLPDGHEWLTAIPVIISLFIIEGLLSVDNILVIAAMARTRPLEERPKALEYGLVGAFVMRGLCLAFAGFIIHVWWLKLLGALYLLWLMASNLGSSEIDTEAEEEEDKAKKAIGRSFWMTVVLIEWTDLSLSIDNIAAAVALDKRLWVICVGVFLGIVALRVAASYAIKLMEKYPILEPTAFLLIGYVGSLLLVELMLEGLRYDVQIPTYVKFIGIATIIGLALLYERSSIFPVGFGKFVNAGHTLLVGINNCFNVVLWPFAWVFNKFRRNTV